MVTFTIVDTCSKGHEWTPENTQNLASGKRRCRECLAEWKRDHITPQCSVKDCKTMSLARGWCKKHYRAWQTYGDPLGLPPEDRYDIPGERWLPVVDWEDLYEVSSVGRVWSMRSQRLLRPSINPYGYPEVALCRDRNNPGGRQLNTPVHRIEAAAFFGPRPDGMGVRHLDGDSTNNAIENLQYGTQQENMDDAIHHGTHRAVWIVAEVAAREACVNGHPYEPESFYFNKSGSKICRTCDRDKITRYRERIAAAKAS